MNRHILSFICLSVVGCTFMVQPTRGQWREISKLDGGDEIDCVYFLDLPGPPRIGFAAGYHIRKTTDGGQSWNKTTILGNTNIIITEITFRDSLTGWAANATGHEACYKTTNGGSTWFPLQGWGFGLCVHYDDSSGKLFLGIYDSAMRVSTNLGSTWQTIPIRNVVSFSFSSASRGILSTWPYDSMDVHGNGYWLDSLSHIYVTSDGGNTWTKGTQIPQADTVNAMDVPSQVLAIRDAPSCFAIYGGPIMLVYRSDDYGLNWNKIATDSIWQVSGRFNTGMLEGNSRRLVVQADSGFFVSTDEGITWTFDDGPASAWEPLSRFYCDKGRTVSGQVISGGGVISAGGLWEEDWGETGVAESALPPPPSEISLSIARSVLTVTSVGSMSSVVVFDVLGRAVASTQVRDATSATLDVGGTPAGVYFVRVTLGTGEVRTIKLVRE